MSTVRERDRSFHTLSVGLQGKIKQKVIYATLAAIDNPFDTEE